MTNNKSLFLICVELCEDTMKDPPHYNPNDVNFEDVETDTQGFIGKDENKHLIYIAFRGTTTFLDILTDSLIFQKDIPFDEKNTDIEVHLGFINAYESVRRSVVEYLDTNPEWDVLITGHSLGGALATLCAYDIQNQYKSRVIRCVTFASPRVGNKEFTRRFNEIISEEDSYRI